MGMFDKVKYEAPCHYCEHILTEWQSKDGPCTLDMLEPWQVHYFYEHCPKCGGWNQYLVNAVVEHIVHKVDIEFDGHGSHPGDDDKPDPEDY